MWTYINTHNAYRRIAVICEVQKSNLSTEVKLGLKWPSDTSLPIALSCSLCLNTTVYGVQKKIDSLLCRYIAM